MTNDEKPNDERMTKHEAQIGPAPEVRQSGFRFLSSFVISPSSFTKFLVIPFRRLVQVLSIVLLVALPFFAIYTHYDEADAIADLPKNDWRNSAVRGIDQMVGDSEERKDFIEQTQGTFWSARIGGVTLSDPLAGAEAVASSRSFYLPLLLSLLIPLAVTIVLGRVFCGWICPMNTLLELIDKCRGLLRVLEIRPRDAKPSLKNKYVLLVLALGFVFVTGVPLLAMVYPPAVLSREAHSIVFGAGIGLGIYLILAICAVELFVSRRWWCRYVCPGGALYSLLGRFRLLRVRRDENKCTHCGDCVRVCQFDLRPMLSITTGMECTNCGACVGGCDANALTYSITLPTPERKHDDQQTKHKRGTSKSKVGPTGTAAAVLLLALLFPSTANAHHILGLPHYSYKENYPQAPTLEYPATTGPYDVLMTSYPGKPVPGEAATIAFYIKDRTTGEVYEKPVTVRVLKTSTFGSNETIFEPATHGPFDNQHKFTVTFPADGEYVTELTMDVEGQTEVIPFLMIAGNPTATKSIVIAIVAGLAFFLVVVRAIKVKRDRRLRRETASRSLEPCESC